MKATILRETAQHGPSLAARDDVPKRHRLEGSPSLWRDMARLGEDKGRQYFPALGL